MRRDNQSENAANCTMRCAHLLQLFVQLFKSGKNTAFLDRHKERSIIVRDTRRLHEVAWNDDSLSFHLHGPGERPPVFLLLSWCWCCILAMGGSAALSNCSETIVDEGGWHAGCHFQVRLRGIVIP